MPTPHALTDLGTPLLPAITPPRRGPHAHRIADIRAVLAGTMPQVQPGQVWADTAPDAAGRTVLVKWVSHHRVVVETLTPRRNAPEGSRSPRDRVGRHMGLSQRRFRPGARGFTLIGPAEAAAPAAQSNDAAAVSAPAAAAECPALVQAVVTTLAGDEDLTLHEWRTAAALVALLGDEVEEYLDTVCDEDGSTPVAIYHSEGTGALLNDAYEWAIEQGAADQWAGTPVS